MDPITEKLKLNTSMHAYYPSIALASNWPKLCPYAETAFTRASNHTVNLANHP